MIFALTDYIQFSLRKGRYGGKQNSPMSIAFEGMPPKETLDQLLPGDIFVTQRFDANFSWAMMYFSSSPVDHCGLYVGDGRVIHTTFVMVEEHPLRFVARGSRILFLRPYDFRVYAEPGDPTGGKLRFYHKWPGKFQVAWGGVEIILGVYPERFRWRFLCDLAIAAGSLDYILWHVEPAPIFLTFVTALAGIAVYNKARWIVRRLLGRPPPAPMSNPDAMLKGFSAGIMFTANGALAVGPFGLLPLEAARQIALSADLPVDGEPLDFGQWMRSFLARLGVMDDDGEHPAA